MRSDSTDRAHALVTRREAARRLGGGVRQGYRGLLQGDLPVYAIGARPESRRELLLAALAALETAVGDLRGPIRPGQRALSRALDALRAALKAES